MSAYPIHSLPPIATAPQPRSPPPAPPPPPSMRSPLDLLSHVALAQLPLSSRSALPSLPLPSVPSLTLRPLPSSSSLPCAPSVPPCPSSSPNNPSLSTLVTTPPCFPLSAVSSLASHPLASSLPSHTSPPPRTHPPPPPPSSTRPPPHRPGSLSFLTTPSSHPISLPMPPPPPSSSSSRRSPSSPSVHVMPTLPTTPATPSCPDTTRRTPLSTSDGNCHRGQKRPMQTFSTPPSPPRTLPRLNLVTVGLSRTNRLAHLSPVSSEDGSPLTDARVLPPLKTRRLGDGAEVAEVSVPPLPPAQQLPPPAVGGSGVSYSSATCVLSGSSGGATAAAVAAAAATGTATAGVAAGRSGIAGRLTNGNGNGRRTTAWTCASTASSNKGRSQPSRFCHICSRTSKKVGLVACANFSSGACRKVVCQKCFVDHKWDWESASRNGDWICTHCRQMCPERAQCAIYRRTNERRREQQLLQRSSRWGGTEGKTGSGQGTSGGDAGTTVLRGAAAASAAATAAGGVGGVRRGDGAK